MKILFALVVFVIYVAPSDSGLPYQKPSNDDSPGLYDDKDQVFVLTARNLSALVLDRNYSTLLEFYNSFCGHCRRFAPKYKKLAADLVPWRDVLKVAAIDCAADENNDVCRQYEILGYPSLRYFGPHYAGGENNYGVVVESQDPDVIRDTLARHLLSEANPGPHWPDLTSLQDSNRDNLFKNEPASLKYAFIVFEPENSTTGAQTILTFHGVKQIKIRRTTDAQLAKQMGVMSFDTIKVFQRGLDSMSISLPNVMPASFKVAIKSFLKENQITFDTDTRNTSESPTNLNENSFLQEVLQRPRYTVYQADLERALRYTLFHEISAHSEISGENLLALQRYLSALSRYNPLGENGRRFVNELKDYVYSHNQKLDGKEFEQKVKALERLHSPVFSSTKWVGCSPSQPGFRGFTCGLWTLFHSMTVQASDDETATDPLEVLQAMHGYVKFFFGCTDCSRHFQEMASRRKIWNVLSKDDAVLWLWAAHNEVNNRLAGDPTEDPKFPKVQFPRQTACPECYREHVPSPADINSPNWNKVEVLQFLKNIHHPYNISRFGVDDESILPDTTTKMRSKRMISNVFSDIDMRMGILLYVFCIGMMFVAVKLFLRKGYRKKPYIHGMLGKV